MVMLVNAELTELEIRPTHRILLEAEEGALQAVADGDDPVRGDRVEPEELAAALAERRSADEPTFGSSCPTATRCC